MTDNLYRLDQLKAKEAYRNANGERLPSVTTITGMLDKPALLFWAWKLGNDGISLEEARRTAANIGTVAHARVEAHLRGMRFCEEDIPADTLTASSNAFMGFLKWWDESGLVIVSTEEKMVSERLGVGGRLDIMAAKAADPSRLVLVDIKATNGIYKEHRIQTAAYKALYEEAHPGRSVGEVWIVRLPKDEAGEPEAVRLVEVGKHIAAFEAMTAAYKTIQALPK
jgi:hypothetical protein